MPFRSLLSFGYAVLVEHADEAGRKDIDRSLSRDYAKESLNALNAPAHNEVSVAELKALRDRASSMMLGDTSAMAELASGLGA